MAEDGAATATWRIFKWCADDVPAPCDRLDGTTIVPGGRATLVFMQVDGQVAFGEVIESNDQMRLAPRPDGGSMSLLLLPYGIAVLTQGSNATVLCSAEFAQAPESVRRAFPCGV